MNSDTPKRRTSLADDTAAMVNLHSTEERRTAYREEIARPSQRLLTRMERLCMGHTLERDTDRPFCRAEMRMSEINRLVDFRHGGKIPETDDPRDGYIFCMAHVAHAHFDDEVDRKSFLLKWLRRVAHWIPDPKDLVDGLLAGMHPRRKHLRDHAAGKLLNLKTAERQALGIRTMSPADISLLQFAKLRKEAKHQADRERAARKRREQGARPQSASATRTKLWLEAGFKNRRAWERHRAKQAASTPILDVVATSSHPCKEGIVATSSPLIDSRIGRDEFATTVANAPPLEPSISDIELGLDGGVSPPAKGAKSSPVTYASIKNGDVPFVAPAGSLELPAVIEPPVKSERKKRASR